MDKLTTNVENKSIIYRPSFLGRLFACLTPLDGVALIKIRDRWIKVLDPGNVHIMSESLRVHSVKPFDQWVLLPAIIPVGRHGKKKHACSLMERRQIRYTLIHSTKSTESKRSTLAVEWRGGRYDTQHEEHGVKVSQNCRSEIAPRRRTGDTNQGSERGREVGRRGEETEEELMSFVADSLFYVLFEQTAIFKSSF